MKKRIFYLAAALMMLCSCSAGPTSVSESTASPAAPASSYAATTASGELRFLSAGGAAGYYLLGGSGNEQLLCYIDYEQAIEVPLCTSPSCAHNSESCTAWIPSEEFVSSLVCVNEDTIAFIDNPVQGAPRIEVADAGGSNRRTLYTAESGQYLETLAFADDTALYCILGELSDDAYQMWLYRIPLDGGAAQAVRTYPNPPPTLEGVSGKDLVLYQYNWGNTTEEAKANGGDHRVFLWNTETGEEQVLDSWHSDAGSNGHTLCWFDGRLYWSSSDAADAIHWLDAQGGSGQTTVAWPDEIAGAAEVTFTLERVTNGYALVTVWGPWGTDLLKRFAVDLSGANAVPAEIPLSFVSNASERPIEIMSETGSELLVHFAQQDTIVTQVQDGGYPARSVEITNRYGMITWEDFLAGIPNYREVTAQ